MVGCSFHFWLLKEIVVWNNPMIVWGYYNRPHWIFGCNSEGIISSMSLCRKQENSTVECQHPLADHTYLTLNKFEDGGRGTLNSEVQVEEVRRCLGWGAAKWGSSWTSLIMSRGAWGSLQTGPALSPWTERHDWKHYLPATSLAGRGKSKTRNFILICV